MLRYLFLIWTILSGFSVYGQGNLTRPNSPLLTQILSNGTPQFFNVISAPEKYRYQIVYTKINRNNKGRPVLENHYFNYSRNQFLYPASLVKLPTCMLALQKMQSLKKQRVSLTSGMVTDTADYCQTTMQWDSTQMNLRPSMEGYIKRMMLVSDNEAYNRTYEFLGYNYIQENLQKKGLGDVRIVQRFVPPCGDYSNLKTNPIYFFQDKDTVYKQKAASAEERLHNPLGEVFMGKGYYDASGFLFPFPRSYYYNNYIPLEDLHSVLSRVFFTNEFPGSRRFEIEDSNLNVLRKYMGMWPRECTFPQYPLPDNYKKYFMIGDGRPKPANADLRIFNVVGRAYGVIADCAYIVDFSNDVEFMLSAILYCNEDEILNDDVYEYYTVGLPFLSELGNLVYDYEMQRKRKHRVHLTGLENLFKPKN